jgi:hypothetical protein
LQPYYHIHADAEFMAEPLREALVERFGFTLDNFEDNRHAAARYAPEQHVTFKTHRPESFQATFAAVRDLVCAGDDFRGYLEGELIAREVRLQGASAFVSSLPIPFRALSASPTGARFRESELHVSVPVAGMDGRLREAFFAMGFFVGTMRKPAGLAEIFTIQGGIEEVAALYPLVEAYLAACGGFDRATLKEEQVAAYCLVNPSKPLPPQISELTLSSSLPALVAA